MIYFSRGELARVLACSSQTIANREKAKVYPAPSRAENNYRQYSLKDVFNLQLISTNQVTPDRVIPVLYDKGIHDPKQAAQMIDQALFSLTND